MHAICGKIRALAFQSSPKLLKALSLELSYTEQSVRKRFQTDAVVLQNSKLRILQYNETVSIPTNCDPLKRIPLQHRFPFYAPPIHKHSSIQLNPTSSIASVRAHTKCWKTTLHKACCLKGAWMHSFIITQYSVHSRYCPVSQNDSGEWQNVCFYHKKNTLQ